MFIENWINLIMKQVKCDRSMHRSVSGIELRVEQHWSTGPAEIWHLRLREKIYENLIGARCRGYSVCYKSICSPTCDLPINWGLCPGSRAQPRGWFGRKRLPNLAHFSLFSTEREVKMKRTCREIQICTKTSIWKPLNFSLCESTSLSSDAYPGIVWVG